MTIETSGRRINIDIDPLLILIFLGDKIDKNIINDIASPDFSIVVRPTNKKNFNSKEGDYDIIIRKDNGEELTLDMPHRGAKILFVLTLLCQKTIGGLPNKYFNNEQAAAAIRSLYDKLYRSGGGQWVSNCAKNKHNLSTFRTHANSAVEENASLDNKTRYWCGFENEKRTVGKNQLQLRKIRIPSERIVFEDAPGSCVPFKQIMEQFPPIEQLFGFRNKNAERIREIRSKRTRDVYPHT